MFQCIPTENKLLYLDRLYTHQWLQYPSVRAFMVETLIQWGLNEDAYELATLDFDAINEEWIQTCDLNFSYAQLQQVYKRIPKYGGDLALKAKWYTHVISVYDGDLLENHEAIRDIRNSYFWGDQLYGVVRSLIRHNHTELAYVLCEEGELTDDQALFLNIERALGMKELSQAEQLLSQISHQSRPDYSFYQGLLAYYKKDFISALRYINKINLTDLSKEAAVLKACILCDTEPKSVMPFMMDLYRKKYVTHREMTIVQIHLLDRQGHTEQAKGVLNQFMEQEQSQLKDLKIFLNL